jgi:hypothetical protein
MLTEDEMSDEMKAELESLDQAMETSGQLAVSLIALARNLEGKHKEEAIRLADIADNLADNLLGIGMNLDRFLCNRIRNSSPKIEVMLGTSK